MASDRLLTNFFVLRIYKLLAQGSHLFIDPADQFKHRVVVLKIVFFKSGEKCKIVEINICISLTESSVKIMPHVCT